MDTLTNTLAERKSNLSPVELQARLVRGERVQLADVREYPEFAAGRIAGSRLLPLGELERSASALDRVQPVVCVCRSGKRSAPAAEKLTALGFTDVRQLGGGLLAWEQAGLPLEKDVHAPWALERQVRLVAGLLVLLGLGLSHIWSVAIALAWFVPLGLVFSAITDSCAMGMLIAKLPWNMQAADLVFQGENI